MWGTPECMLHKIGEPDDVCTACLHCTQNDKTETESQEIFLTKLLIAQREYCFSVKKCWLGTIYRMFSQMKFLGEKMRLNYTAVFTVHAFWKLGFIFVFWIRIPVNRRNRITTLMMMRMRITRSPWEHQKIGKMYLEKYQVSWP